MSFNTDRADEALKYFHNEAVVKFPDTYQFQFAELTAALDAIPSYDFRERFGKTLATTQVSQTVISRAMIKLADDSGGKIPAAPRDLTAFYLYVADSTTQWTFGDWTNAVETATVETAKDVGTVALFAGGGALVIAAIVAGLYLARKAA